MSKHMHTIIIPDNTYGEATLRLRNTITKCQSIKWFMPEVQPISIDYLDRQIEIFSLSIHELSPKTPSRFDLNFIEGDWSLLHQHRWGFDPYFPWGHRFDDSMRVLGTLVRNIKAMIIRSHQLSSLIKPPLWLIIGNPDVSGDPIIAHENVFRVANLDLQYDSHNWRVAWGLR